MGDIKTDVTLLENHVFGLATNMLEEYSEFFPFAAALTRDRQIVSIEYPGEEEYPDPEAVVSYLAKKLQFGARTDKYIATAMTFDSRTIPPGSNHKMETIAVNLDHCDHYSIIVLTPYQIRSRKLGFGPRYMQEGNYRVFAQNNESKTGT